MQLPCLTLRPALLLTAALAFAFPTARGAAGENVVGRQSQNEGITIVPAPQKVTIDGDLSEWDLSGRIWCFADLALREEYSTEIAAMWDEKYLYLGLQFRDPTPLHNVVDPKFSASSAWKSDSVQLRVMTGDRISHITAWHFTPQELACLYVQRGKSLKETFGGERFVLTAPEGEELGQGVRLAHRQTGAGSYLQEIRLPWTLLWQEVPKLQAGMTFRLGFELFWGDTTGKNWPEHRYADNMQPGVTNREFYWKRPQPWGDGTLSSENHVPRRKYVADDVQRVEGSIPVRVELPASAERFTVALDDLQGRRVRTVGADLNPLDYTVAVQGDRRTVEVLWDGLTERGELAAPGTYQTQGLVRGPLDARYELNFYNPGTPPWKTVDGSGSWCADHTPVADVAAGGGRIFLSSGYAEGGSGLIGLDSTGRKRWGEHRGSKEIAADAEYVYAIYGQDHQLSLLRLAAADGRYAPWLRDGKPLPLELPLSVIFGKHDAPSQVKDIHVWGDLIVLALDDDRLAFIDKHSAALRSTMEADNPTAIAAGATGPLYAVLAGQLHELVPQGQGDLVFQTRVVPTPTLGKAGALAVDRDGQLAILDLGPDCQVKGYSPQGKLLYTCGRKGGRPPVGDFDPQAMSAMRKIAVDHLGQIWVVESWEYPRRVSVWNAQDGRLVRDYIGNAHYSASGCYLHDQDPTLAYVGPVEIQLDRQASDWRVTRTLWLPQEGDLDRFEIESGFTLPQRFRSDASGQMREYLFAKPYRPTKPLTLFMQDDDGSWRPVAAVGPVSAFSGKREHRLEDSQPPEGIFAGLSLDQGCYWNDLNHDGRVQFGECTIVDEPLANACGWGGRMSGDLTFYASQGRRGRTFQFKPIRFTQHGAPVYGPAGTRPIGPEGMHGDLVPVAEESLLLCLGGFRSGQNYMALSTAEENFGEVLWEYPNPYPAVHGSHEATMPAPGLLIGPLKHLGVADTGAPVGRVIALRGNLGQDYFFTTDGLMIGALFRDCRLPSRALPATAEELRGMSMASFSEGSEPFNGWFGRQDDGQIRMLTGMARQSPMLLRMHGFDSIRRFQGGTLTVDASTLARADLENARRAAAEAEKHYALTRAEKTPTIDADPREWRAVPQVEIRKSGSPERAQAALQYDDEHLYVLFHVSDASPMRNTGKDIRRLFKTGDAVDLQLSTKLDAEAARQPNEHHVRLLVAVHDSQPVVVRMKPVDPRAESQLAITYHSPVQEHRFDRVDLLAEAQVALQRHANRYLVEVAIPLQSLGLELKPGSTLRGDLGFISSDADGTQNVARTYWSNAATNLVSDEPSEAWLYPAFWGTFTIK